MNNIERIALINGISALLKPLSARKEQKTVSNLLKARKIICNLLTSLAFLLSIIGCGNVGNYLDLAKDKGISRGYIDVLNYWTKKETVYSQFETKVQITATYKSDEFNRAYNAEYGRIYYLTEAEKKSREDMQSGFTRESREFFFYAAMAKKDTNDFDRPNSIWTIFLIDEKGNHIKPLDVRRIDKVTPLMEEFYPYINKYYGNCYSLKFPPLLDGEKTGGGVKRTMKIIFTSVLGQAELSWP